MKNTKEDLGVEQKKEFTGVWIPKHIIEDNNLSMTEKIIYAEIGCFEVCYKKNDTLGERYGLKANTISKIVKKLVKKEYIEIVGFDGRTRKIRAKRDKPNPKQTVKKIQCRVAKKSKADMENNQTLKNNDSVLNQGKKQVKSEGGDNNSEHNIENVVTKVTSNSEELRGKNQTKNSFSEIKLNKKIAMWKDVTNKFKDFYQNKTERNYLKKLYATYPEEDVDMAVQLLPKINNLPQKEFFWKIFAPSELYKRWEHWISAYQSKKYEFENSKSRADWV